MKRLYFVCLVVLAILFSVAVGRSRAVSPPQVGGLFPEFELVMPRDVTERNYLGLSGGVAFFGEKTFKLTQIKSEVVILEIFSMYCPYCQAEAPNVKALYEKIENNPKLRSRIKIVGIGAGNNSYEVETFKKRYQIPFPLFADGEFILHKKFGEVRTPYFIVFRNYPNGSYRIVYSKLGAFGDVDQFLDTIVKLTGIK
jgi:thiol-disulfide isomerase/thioredoxin